ncbi:SDR family NAD(P)-dependent oxidoreductase [Agromyces sp. MMS24-K17]|uniref:SDR family NAD(P)-dependent oxidoreductase n=1 Tax=Agromyces sp. MMS24-K17 TaxID=3372850 RepID=UPI003754ED5F
MSAQARRSTRRRRPPSSPSRGPSPFELGPRGIRVNSIAPGPTATDFNGGAMRDDPELRDGLAARTALGRVGEPDEIADAIVALASNDLRWITAERIEVSGGSLL